MPDNCCPGCGAELPEKARVCEKCKTLSSATGECVACRAPMPPNAEKCRVCNSYQGKRRWFDFGSSTPSAITALVAVIGLSVSVISSHAKARSSTKAAIAGSTKDTLLVAFVNSGNAASVVRDVAIIADGEVVRIGRISPQTEDEARQLLKGPDSVVLHYNVTSIEISEAAKNSQFWTNYGSTPIHLTGTVIESDGTAIKLKDDATLATIKAIIEESCDNKCKE